MQADNLGGDIDSTRHDGDSSDLVQIWGGHPLHPKLEETNSNNNPLRYVAIWG